MDDQPEVIRQQMEVTRSDLTEKIEALQQQVLDTVQDTTQAVSDTVESVKDAVQETVGTVKDTVSDTVDAVKEALDLPGYVKEYPWASFGAAVAAGFVGGRLTGRRPAVGIGELRSRGQATIDRDNQGYDGPRGPQEDNTRVSHRAAFVPETPAQKAPSWLGQLAAQFAPEIDKVKGLALGAVGALVRDVVAQSVEGQFGDRLTEVIDDFTRKLGGEPIRGPLFQTGGAAGKSSREREADCEMRRERVRHPA